MLRGIARLVGVGLSRLHRGRHGRSDVDELHLAILQPALGGIAAVAALLIGAAMFRPAPLAIPLAVAFFGLLAIVVIALRLLRYGVHQAALFTTFTLTALILYVTWARASGAVAILLPLIVGLAITTVRPVAGVILALAASGFVVYALAGGLPPLVFDPELATIVVFAVWLNVFLAWATTRPVRTALGWAWQAYDQSTANLHALRERQRELLSTLKSLNEAYDRLEHLNDELARARRVAEEARRLKAEFAANISHELRTPLNLIIGFSEVMATAPQAYRGEPLPAAYRADLDTIYRNARNLASLIDDVLDLSEIEAGRTGLVREPLSLRQVAEEAVAAIAPLFETKGLSIQVAMPPNLPPILADRTRIRQVLINLLANAVRFTHRGGVQITAEIQDRDVVVSVADTGIGISPEHLDRVFEAFYHVDGPRRHPLGGSGLGLAICKQLVELHGGSIWVESEVGAGAIFHFTLPLTPNVVPIALPGDWTRWEQATETRMAAEPVVVVASPDPVVAHLFERYLDSYHVVALPVPEAAQMARAAGPARAVIVVSSSPAEVLNAIETAQDQPDGLPTIYCVLPTTDDLARRLGVAAYLVKPVAGEDLLQTLDGLARPVRSVLVVDDEPDMVRLIGRLLRSSRRGCRIWRATSGVEALALLRTHRPDVVLLDLLMPEVDGYVVIGEMRQDERLRDVPVVVMTARSGREVALHAGLVALTRPGGFSVRELMSCVRQSLDSLLTDSDRRDTAAAVEPRSRVSRAAADDSLASE